MIDNYQVPQLQAPYQVTNNPQLQAPYQVPNNPQIRYNTTYRGTGRNIVANGGKNLSIENKTT